MYQSLKDYIDILDTSIISNERKSILEPLIEYIQSQMDNNGPINLNLICTHNSRRSHLSQVWAQTLAFYYGIHDIQCYSGGTEATAVFPKVIDTLIEQGFQIKAISECRNPVYAIKYDENANAIIAFSKSFDDSFNAQSNFAAVMTCSHADENCPFIPGANQRIALNYEDPKLFDGTPQQTEKYKERSTQIATEMKYVFSEIAKD
ncbi:protein-tyrosine-phosphatase [Winogradskyella sp. DF17]|uniref:Protein-tyrosine-phosphatase n=1 Tax=Winogradskyella pelagia TaxID=2819984 RepID=A0ABS3T283_9FLAO|nr:protein-tyrosine-phosphatase [Winogradskyella sp. DF17]MBO3116554.1 protein-tyrosine-phosphatase [Winogradskyella sp. DF17]